MKKSRAWLYDLLFVLVLVAAAYFRLSGLNWDENQHLHPDERFMTMVQSAIEPVHSFSEYFDTANSPLNPNNRGYGFYVYGTLPLFMVRYVAAWMNDFSQVVAQYIQTHNAEGVKQAFGWLLEAPNWAGYDEGALVGRVLSAFSDLGTIFLLYLIAARLYGRKIALLAAAFSSLAVMQIQQSHFFTVDNFANFFMFLAVYFAVEVAAGNGGRNSEARSQKDEVKPEAVGESIPSAEAQVKDTQSEPRNIQEYILSGLGSPLFWNTIGFGIALGMAVASKLNAAPLAALLPGALLLRYFRTKDGGRKAEAGPSSAHRPFSLELALILLVLGAMMSVISFRVFQPYAFSGPGFLGVKPNPLWVKTIQDQRAQASGDVDFPPALQWARRSVFFSGFNLTAWGLGWPLGILAWAGFLYMGWRIFRGEWKEHILLWSWTAAYFGWQSMQWNPTMRYQLPVYPLLALTAAWFIFKGPRFFKPSAEASAPRTPHYLVRIAYSVLAIFVLAATFSWAYAFSQIYTRGHSRVQAARWIYQNVPGPYNLKIGDYTQPMPFPKEYAINAFVPYDVQFTALASGNLTAITLGKATGNGAGPQTLSVSFATQPIGESTEILASASLTADFTPDPQAAPYTLTFDRPAPLEKGQDYFLRFRVTGNLALSGSAPVHETDWDDGLPLRMDGYDAYGGIYMGDLNFQMYWDDNPEKLERFVTNLDAGDYIFITSNRQWATTTRVPERYPLTTAFYRNLIGCPEGKDVIWCYNVADPGMFQGKLGYELLKTFTSYPQIGSWIINTQFADEAFTVYDAPKVLIFKKTAAYNPQTARSILGAVDLSNVVHLTPRKASSYRSLDLMLQPDSLLIQQEGGTWSDLFSYDSFQNKYPALGLLIWYIAIALLGIFTWPFLRLILPGLADKGYPLARLSGLLLLAWFVWMVGSLGGEYSRLTIAAGYGLIILAGALAAFLKRDELWAEIQSQKRYFLTSEGLFLLLFLFDLLIRIGNPDLWHPSKGGERPMDFAYLNAVIKSTTFPPYDPWFAGGYLNYYYWGFVLVGTPIKLLGIAPSIAYNYVLPTLFALLGIGGFSVAWNLVESRMSKAEEQNGIRHSTFDIRPVAGLAAAAGLVLLGNLGTIRMIYQGLQRLTVNNELFNSPDVWIYQRWVWALQGIGKILSGESLPYGWGEWYWNPSRIIPAPNDVEPITEFPLFTFLYSDLHAHMIALPLTVLVIAWALSVLSARNMSRGAWLGALAFGGLAIGALRPTNTWDFPTYLILGALVAGYAIFRYADVGDKSRFGLSPVLQRGLLALIGMGLLVGFSLLFFQPFARWFGLGYSQVRQWTGAKTPIWSYWGHWGLFLFAIISWMAWETRQWMAQTPVSALSKLKPYEILIEISLALLAAAVGALMFIAKANIAWFILPLAFWALALMLRPGLPDAKRLVLFMIGTGLVLTLVVEVIVLVGDIGRMNTVFKFYLQVWVLFAISAAAGLGWILHEFDQWSRGWRSFFQTAGGILLASAFLFTFTATFYKMRDRMTSGVPWTLDSMTYMNYSTYSESGMDMDLSQDYRAIRWMQENIKGSPVILEGAPAGIQYTWFSRYSIYTGLPTVVGWQWHQEQQRVLMPPGTVALRGDEAQEFYRILDPNMASEFLQKYNARYIVVGQLERAYFPEGLSKFEEYDGTLWKEIYHDKDTVIYQVLP